MVLVSILFREDVGEIFVSWYVEDFHFFVLNRFTDCVLVDLDVAEVLCCFCFRPQDAGHVVIVDANGLIEKFVLKAQVFDDVADELNVTNALVRGVDFRLCGASCGNVLPF